MRDNEGRFVPGAPSENHAPVGAVRIRTRHKRGGEERAFVKVAEPNVWMLRARLVWEKKHGPIPRGMSVHHKDENTLNDALRNLELLSKAKHLEEHRPSFQARCVRALVKARRARRWSTKSATKRTGAPPKWTEEQLASALDAMAKGMSPHAASAKFGVSRTTLYRKQRGMR